MKESDTPYDDSELNPPRIIRSTKKKHKKKKGKRSKNENKEEEVKVEEKVEVPQEKSEIKKFYELKESYKCRKDPEKCFVHLQNFYNDLKEVNLNELITEENLNYFLNINQDENIKLDVLLSKIYNKIFSSEDIYKKYFTDDKDENKKKLSLIMKLMLEPIIILENFSHCFISLENYQLKESLLRLIKFIYINLKDCLAKEELDYISNLLNELPNKFFSTNYLEIIKYKNIIYKNNAELLKNIDNIDELFFELETYYEQLSSLELLFNDLEIDEDVEKLNNYSSVSNRDIKRNTRDEEEDEDEVETQDKSRRNKSTSKKNNEIEYDENDIISYGNFLLKICIYQKFLLTQGKLVEKNNKNKINKENKENKEDDEFLEDDDPNKTLSLFVIDAVKNINSRIQNKSNENIGLGELLNGKICLSLQEAKNYVEIIKKNINNFNSLAGNSHNQTIKEIKDKLDKYISLSNENKLVNINIEKINNIQYFSNFSKNGIVIPNRDSRILYIENNEDKKGLLLIEFGQSDEKKDIIFRINKYDFLTDSFIPIYNTGKINKRCKLCIYFDENSLYQIEFDNKYSWLNSKYIDFSVSLFRIIDDDKNNINEEINNENNINNINNDNNIINNEDNENQNEDKIYSEIKVSDIILNNERNIKFYCNNEEANYTFNCNKIYKKIKEFQALESKNSNESKEIGLSLLINLNSIRFITSENGKIKYTEVIDEKDKIISKQFFNRTLSKYLNENFKLNENENNENNENKKNIFINLYCLNKNLALISPKIKETINALNEYSINNVDKNQNKIYSQFLQKLGFYPDKKIGGYEIEYNLYDFCDQCLIYHLFLNHIQQKFVESSTLVLIFDKYAVNISALNEGAIYNKFKSLENSWKKKYYSKLKMDDFKSIVDFIAAISDSFDGLDLVLCFMDNEEKKDELLSLFKQIKKYTEEKIDEPINVYVYNEDNFISKIFKYIDLFSDE